MEIIEDEDWVDEAQNGEYLPTPAEIQQACQEIQATWSRKEYRQRCVGRPNRKQLRTRILVLPHQ